MGRLRARPWHQDEYIATNLGENPTLGLRLRCVKIAGMGATLGGPPIPREAAGLVRPEAAVGYQVLNFGVKSINTG